MIHKINEEAEGLTEEEVKETEQLFSRTVSSLSFIYGQKPSEMVFVLQEVGTFDELIMLCFVSKNLEIPIKELYLMTVEERKNIEEHRNKVIHLWKKKEDTSAANAVSG